MNLVDFKDTSSVNCYICKNCDTRILNNILELQKHLSRLKDTVKGYISSFQCNVASGNIIKRVSSTFSTAVPPPKRICLDSDRSPSTSPAITVRWYLIYLCSGHSTRGLNSNTIYHACHLHTQSFIFVKASSEPVTVCAYQRARPQTLRLFDL